MISRSNVARKGLVFLHEAANAKVAANAHSSRDGLEISGDCLKERTLSNAVIPNKSNTFSEVDTKGDWWKRKGSFVVGTTTESQDDGFDLNGGIDTMA